MRIKIERVQIYSDKNVNKGTLIKLDGHWEWESLEGYHQYTAEELTELANLVTQATASRLKVEDEEIT